MATWTNISADTFKIDYTDAARTSMSGKVRLTMQYDADSDTPTSVKVRFKLDRTDASTHYNDSMYLIYNANNDPTDITRMLLKIKDYQTWQNASWPYYTDSITLTKGYTSETFYVQDIWICNNGNTATTVSLSNFLAVFASDGSRKNYAKRGGGSTSIAISKSSTVATAVGKGTTTIADHGNNTFTITATKGEDGDNNTAGGPSKLSWGYTKSYGSTYTSGARKVLTTKGTEEKRTVYATSTTTAKYGSDKEATAERDIRQYLPPAWSEETTPTISYTKSRLTLKENWVFSWPEAEKQGYSGVAGYRIRIFKTPAGQTVSVANERSIPIISRTTGEVISTDGVEDPAYKSSSTAWVRNRYFYDRPASSGTTMTINPALLDLQPGDQVRFHVYPYSKDSNGNFGCWPYPEVALTYDTANKIYKDADGNYYPYLFTTTETVDSYTGRNELISDIYTVQNAGIVHIKTSSGWKEGQVWVKTSSGWKEAETVNIKTSAGWKESQ